jgi:hypothetical protein
VTIFLHHPALALIPRASEKHLYFVDAVIISKSIKVELSVLLFSDGYLIIHDEVYGCSNDNAIRFSELKVKACAHMKRKMNSLVR